MRKNKHEFLKTFQRKVAKELAQQGLSQTKLRVKDDGSVTSVVAQHLLANQLYTGKAVLVYPTTLEEQAELTLSSVLLNKKIPVKKKILSSSPEEDIKRYATYFKLKGVIKKRNNETTKLLEELQKISPDATFTLAKYASLEE